MKICALWALVCCLPAWALADDSLKKAEQLISQMDYAAALSMVQKVMASKNSEPADLASAYYLKGVCQASMEQAIKAVNTFRKLLAIQPQYKIPENASPRVKSPFFKALSMQGQSPLALKHTAPAAPPRLNDFGLTVVLKSNPFNLIRSIRLQYKTQQDSQWLAVQVKVKTKKTKTRKVHCKLPKNLTGSSVEYFFEGLNKNGGTLIRLGDMTNPYQLSASQASKAVATSPDKDVLNFSQGSTAQAKTDTEASTEKNQEKQKLTAPDKPTGEQPSDKSSSKAFDVLAQLQKGNQSAQTDSNMEPKSEALEIEPRSDQAEESKPWYTTWWFWTAVGGAVAAGVVVGVVMATSSGESSMAPGYNVVVNW